MAHSFSLTDSAESRQGSGRCRLLGSPKVLRFPSNMALLLLDDVAGMNPSTKVNADSVAADSDDHSLVAATSSPPAPCF